MLCCTKMVVLAFAKFVLLIPWIWRRGAEKCGTFMCVNDFEPFYLHLCIIVTISLSFDSIVILCSSGYYSRYTGRENQNLLPSS
jgi:hypothetical protein